MLLLLLLNWVRATPDRPYMSSKSSSQTRLIGQCTLCVSNWRHIQELCCHLFTPHDIASQHHVTGITLPDRMHAHIRGIWQAPIRGIKHVQNKLVHKQTTRVEDGLCCGGSTLNSTECTAVKKSHHTIQHRHWGVESQHQRQLAARHFGKGL
jgi:hypothetical protein